MIGKFKYSYVAKFNPTNFTDIDRDNLHSAFDWCDKNLLEYRFGWTGYSSSDKFVLQFKTREDLIVFKLVFNF